MDERRIFKCNHIKNSMQEIGSCFLGVAGENREHTNRPLKEINAIYFLTEDNSLVNSDGSF